MKLKTFTRYLLRKYFLFATSTGLWTLLYVLKEHPNANVIVIGIGLEIGAHFDDETQYFTVGARKDNYLAPKIPSKFKHRIYTIDENFSKVTGVTLLEGTFIG